MTNNFSIKSWSDVREIVYILALLSAGIVWGMKLEGRLDLQQEKIVTLEKQVGSGVLPRAEERLDEHDRRLDRLENHD